MALDPRSENIDLDAMRREAGSSRLDALLVLNATHANLKARLGRPTLNLSHRYRDLNLFTRLIQLELDHLAGRTTRSSNGVAGATHSEDAREAKGETDLAWSHPWGLTLREDLQIVLLRYSAKRERLGRLLTRSARATAATAATRRYEAIAHTIPWRLRAPPPTLPAAAPTRVERLKTRAQALGPPPRAGGRELALAGAIGAVVLAVMLDASDPRSVDRAAQPGLSAGAGSVLQVAVPPPFGRLHVAPVESASGADDAPEKRGQTTGAARDPQANDGASQAGGGESVPASVPASASAPVAPVPTSAAPAPTPPAPSPQPAPAAETPPEFGFEH